MNKHDDGVSGLIFLKYLKQIHIFIGMNILHINTIYFEVLIKNNKKI